MISAKYKSTIYSTEIELVKSPDEVFSHVIALSKWWPEEYFGDSIKMDTEFVLKTGESHYSKNKVIEFIPDKKLVWLTMESIRKSDNFDWTGTKFIFELTSKPGSTRLRFTYDGVVLEDESERLAKICDMTIQEMFYNFINSGKVNSCL